MFWITKTIRNVTIVVPVLMTSCQVSDQPKNGPLTPHKTMLKNANAKKAIDGLAIPLHPGAEQYYREIGLLVQASQSQ